ncbi:3-hydroxyacyl-CoA dehydrogenase NAD-binding domain-containing protein, partial [Staphylococcus epidermidis]|uniref:3-hydroxyacyl-CoA dehydrogenase NAD-binding domain-containing protein n=1 Tax=Staphylococcus epidermidis TaxID=1282 RepID=UPI0021B1E8DB
ADHIQENVPQLQQIKDALLKHIHFYPKPQPTIPSTTSPIIPSQLQPNLSHPQPLLLPHPFHPLYIFPLLQILPAKQTSQQTTLKPQH